MKRYKITYTFNVETDNLTLWEMKLANLLIENDKEVIDFYTVKEEEVK